MALAAFADKKFKLSSSEKFDDYMKALVSRRRRAMGAPFGPAYARVSGSLGVCFSVYVVPGVSHGTSKNLYPRLPLSQHSQL